MDLVAFVVAGQRVHHQVDTETIGQNPLALPAGDHGLGVAAVGVHRPGGGPVVAADDHRADAVIGAVLVALHPYRVAGETAGEIAQRWGMVHLLDCAADLREHIAGVCPDEPDGADDNDENDGQHHGILSDVLSFFIAPQLA